MKRKDSFVSVKGKKNVERLFQKGVSFFLYPFKVFYLKDGDTLQHQLFISIPKRNIKKAVKRNLVKRRIKEAFFHYYKVHISSNDSKYKIALVYVAKDTISFSELHKSLSKILTRVFDNKT